MAARKFLDNDGLRFLLVQLDALIDQKTQINVVSSIDGNSTNAQIAGAKAVYDLVNAAIAGLGTLSMEVVASLPATGEANIIYLVAVDADTYRQWIYSGGQWWDLGIAEIDLSNYWSKDELVALTNAEIQAVFDDVMGV
jgi:hypothetical protein